MPSKPTKLPRWADNPAAAPPALNAVTEPFEAAGDGTPNKDNGFPAGVLRRQILNWLHRTTYEWLAWLENRIFRTAPFFVDHALPEGDAPVNGVGLAEADGTAFSARVFTAGLDTGLVEGPPSGFVYSASTWTYWDLDKDGTWVPAITAIGAGAPAVAADAVRVYRVDTDATSRVLTTDYRSTRVRVSTHDVDAEARFGRNKLATEAEASTFRRSTPHRLAGTGFVAIETFPGLTGVLDAQGAGFHFYLWEEENTVVAVRNARWAFYVVVGAHVWVREGPETNCEFLTFRAGKIVARTIDTTVAGEWFTKAQALTTAPTGSNGIEDGIRFQGSVRAGGWIPSTGFGNLEPRFISHPIAAAAQRVLDVDLDYLKISHLTALSGGTGGGTANAACGGELWTNCRINTTTGRFERISNGSPSYKLEVSSIGLRLLYHAAASPSPWDDTIALDDWEVAYRPQSTGVQYHTTPFAKAVRGYKDLGASGDSSGGEFWAQRATSDSESDLWGNFGPDPSFVPLTANDLTFILPIDFPASAHGAVIQSCTVFGKVDAVVGAELRIALLRKVLADGSNGSMRLDNAGWTETGTIAWGAIDIPCNETEANRTLDLSLYSYCLIGYAPEFGVLGHPGIDFSFAACQIQTQFLS